MCSGLRGTASQVHMGLVSIWKYVEVMGRLLGNQVLFRVFHGRWNSEKYACRAFLSS